MKNQSLWLQINNFSIDDDSSQLKFSERLERENLGWSRDYTLRVLEEYKRFIYLGCVSSISVTPSDEVDQAWHLHMIYTRQYWENFMSILPIKFHHGPTKGGSKENERFDDQYSYTKQLYREEFLIEPPEDIWPPKEIRFAPNDFKRVNLSNHWVIPVGDLKAMLVVIFKTIKQKLNKLCGI